MREAPAPFDIAIVGAGPAGCVAALAHAQAGARVALLEANPRASERFAGEWLHPLGVRLLRELGIDLLKDCSYESGRGFALFPEDGSTPIVLPYSASDSASDSAPGITSGRGFSGGHEALVAKLRSAASDHPAVVYLPGRRVTHYASGLLDVAPGRGAEGLQIRAGRVIGADGRASRMRAAAGFARNCKTLSMMAGLELKGAELPIDGFGHVFLGGPGPILAYRIDEDRVRLCLDVPLASPRDAESLFESYGHVLSDSLRQAFADSLRSQAPAWAINQIQSRSCFGRSDLALIGDAVGFAHPLTAAGMTHAFGDATDLAKHATFEEFVAARRRSTRVSGLLAGVLYEVLSGNTPTTTSIRHGIYHLWRTNPSERSRTMRYLAAEEEKTAAFSISFTRVAAPALARLVARECMRGDFCAAADVLREARDRAVWLVRGVLGRSEEVAAPGAESDSDELDTTIRESDPKTVGPEERRRPRRAPAGASALEAIDRGSNMLTTMQHDDGSFEGEVSWSPMLAAQYVLFCQATGRQISASRRDGLLRHFEQTQRSDGLWGLHAVSEPYLFVTTLVYVAARLLGLSAESPQLERARTFICGEGVLAIPSWGKFWLAIVGLYDWRGAPPVLPEIWALPSWLPVHPSSYYCHTRLIYLAMSVVYARRLRSPETTALAAVRNELYPDGMECVDWDAARRSLRQAEVNSPPGLVLRSAQRVLAWYEMRHNRSLRNRILGELDDRIRWELESTDYTSLSPVSGLLNLLALHAGNREDPSIERGLERLEAWFWEDQEDGSRIAGARSATWDTSFALQALAAAGPDQSSASDAIERATSFLEAQQIVEAHEGHNAAFRLDPRGGFCFAGVWHGWPVSDCTAEALDALAAAAPGRMHPGAERNAIRFLLRCQNRDGGFGSYEAKRTRVALEWLNPAEMFGECMTEHSYVECTASALSALSGFRKRHPDVLRRDVGSAMAQAEGRLRALQLSSGAWRGVWGVHHLYGTLFAVRGLVAAGAVPGDTAIRSACEWIREQQHADGGWGEDHSTCSSGHYSPQAHSQVIQTSWALMALLEAQDSDWSAIVRGAEFLMGHQDAAGQWPREEPAGLFFRTALLDYELYRAYFPVWALALYETRRTGRSSILESQSRRDRVTIECSVDGRTV
jgi:squalene/oxidosqualene cyclase-like protein